MTDVLAEDNRYIRKRIWRARLQSIPFYLSRIFPVKKNKIVFCCIEGTTGYTCNPKYIAEELIRLNKKAEPHKRFELVWLVDDISRKFPDEIRVVYNCLRNRAYELSTARFWIDNSRKQLEVRKRKGQVYIQTWHAKLGFKPTCLDRGTSFSRIAYLVSSHDSSMIDYVLSNSAWYDNTLPTGMIYNGPTLRTGSPRCDILVNGRTGLRAQVRKAYSLSENTRILMYAPTFRGGSQGGRRTIALSQGFPDYQELKNGLERRFGGQWVIFLRLHPQLVARNLDLGIENTSMIDVSRVDDMYEILSGCDAFMTDYSSAAFDAMVMRIPVFLYADDYGEYEKERGELLWDMSQLPFPLARNDKELQQQIEEFDDDSYQDGLDRLIKDTEMAEDGMAAKRVADFLNRSREQDIRT